jgi:O-antigen/teichoic acid export membrane protein
VFLAHSVGSALIAKGNIINKVKVMGLVAFINIGLNFILIPLHGPSGAAIATVISSIVLVAGYYAVNKYGQIKNDGGLFNAKNN